MRLSAFPLLACLIVAAWAAPPTFKVVNQFGADKLTSPLALSKNGDVLLAQDKAAKAVVELNRVGGKFKQSRVVFAAPNIAFAALQPAGGLAVIITRGKEPTLVINTVKRQADKSWKTVAAPFIIKTDGYLGALSLVGPAGAGAVLGLAYVPPNTPFGGAGYIHRLSTVNGALKWVQVAALSPKTRPGSVSLDATGTIAVVSTYLPLNKQGEAYGRVRVYKASGAALTKWVLINEFKPKDDTKVSLYGYASAISADAKIIAFTVMGTVPLARFNPANGETQIYGANKGGYTYITTIPGPYKPPAGDISGSTINLSSDGSVIAVGANTGPIYSIQGYQKGAVHVYHRINNVKWTNAYSTAGKSPFTKPVTGVAAFSEDVALSGSGNVLALTGIVYTPAKEFSYVSVLTDL